MNWNTAARPVIDSEESATVFLRFADQMFEPLTSGALWWPAEQALLVADLHFEKLSSYARRGSLLPPYDTGATLKRLAADVERTGAHEIVALGDSFHRDEGTETLLDADKLRLAALMGKVRWTWISGNHDPSPHALGGTCVTSLERRGLTLSHHPKRGTPGLVAGHLHPAARSWPTAARPPRLLRTRRQPAGSARLWCIHGNAQHPEPGLRRPARLG